MDGCWIEQPENPEAAVAYDLDKVLAQYADHGLEEVDFRPGLWRRMAIQDQDFLIARKSEAQPAVGAPR
jgi:hypothetical protein